MRIFSPLICALVISCSSMSESQPDIAPTKTPQRAESTNTLFIGNSFTFWRGGLWRQLEKLSKGTSPTLGYQTDCVVRGGASLEVMWRRTKAPTRIAEGGWDVVILQEDLPETNVDSFGEYAAKFVTAVRAVDARPILFMAWEYERLNWISFDSILEAHRKVAADLEVEVAPVGLAWRNARAARPDLDMYARDREHPSIAGSYLALMVIEATISGLPPVEHDPETVRLPGLERIEPDDAAFLRLIAQRTIDEWRSAKMK